MDIDENLSRKTDWGTLPYPVIHMIAKLDLQNFNADDRKWPMLSQVGRFFVENPPTLTHRPLWITGRILSPYPYHMGHMI